MKIFFAIVLSLVCIQYPALNENNKITDTMKLKIKIGTDTFTATLQENATTNALKEKLPMTIDMIELNGNEKYFDLPVVLPTNASNSKTIKTGDLMMYGSSTLVLFYKTFSTSYSYTKLGRVDDPTGLATALGNGNVSVSFELQ